MTTHVNKRKEFREDRPPRDINYKKENDKVILKISRFDHILLTFQVFVTIGVLAIIISSIRDLGGIIITTFILGGLIIWIKKNVQSKLKLIIHSNHLEFIFGKHHNKNISLLLDTIKVAKIESNIVGGTSYGGIPGLNSKSSTFRNFIVELKNGKEHYIPLLEESHKRYFKNLINKYKK